MRRERDSMGEVELPDGALWGAQTQRAVNNFPLSGLCMPKRFLRALAMVKRACASANMKLGRLEKSLGEAIVWACDQIIKGKLDDQFPVDVFQTGSGTSTNMNANEVIANRAILVLGGTVGSKTPVHPNDHVNMSQSSNDVIPTAIHVSALMAVRDLLIPALERLTGTLRDKAKAFDFVVKPGRTHNQDAVPMRLGQEFGGWAMQAEKGVDRARRIMEVLRELPIGGTAVGTGINRPVRFPTAVIEELLQITGFAFFEATDHFEANAARDACVEASGELKTIAVSLSKIANDVRWLGSGPRGGLGELVLPEVQPGSSIIPGKADPVIAGALIMAAGQVIGNDAAITLGGLGSVLEQNSMMPLIAHNLIQSVEILANSALAFSDKCVAGIEADVQRCKALLERNLALATALAPIIGFDRASEISCEAYRTGKTIREVALQKNVLPVEQLDEILDPGTMTEPGVAG